MKLKFKACKEAGFGGYGFGRNLAVRGNFDIRNILLLDIQDEYLSHRTGPIHDTERRGCIQDECLPDRRQDVAKRPVLSPLVEAGKISPFF